MLYISKALAYSNYAVMDTDDGVEEVYKLSELRRFVLVDGLDIKGCTVSEDGTGVFVKVVSPNQTLFQVKNQMLNGIDIQVSNGEIVSIALVKPLTQDLTVNLSDFGTVLGKHFIATYTEDIRGKTNGHSLILVIDEKITAYKNSFNRFYVGFGNKHNVVLDIQSATDSLARQLYNWFKSDSGFYLNDIGVYVRDNKVRQGYYMAEQVVFRGQYSMQRRNNISYTIPASRDAVRKMPEVMNGGKIYGKKKESFLLKACKNMNMNTPFYKGSGDFEVSVELFVNDCVKPNYEIDESYFNIMGYFESDEMPKKRRNGSEFYRLSNFIYYFDSNDKVHECFYKEFIPALRKLLLDKLGSSPDLQEYKRRMR
jgi:hypothetical protein